MMSQVLRPGVQNGEHTDACAKVARIFRYLQQRLRSCPEQVTVEHALVPECERRQLLRPSKDDMGVGHRQQA
jgi:hypothetical protein